MAGGYLAMRRNKKYVRKAFWVHQHEKEEEFLSQMSRDGYHFKKLYIGIPPKYEFDIGEKTDYIYQIDYITKKEETEDYHQLFKDAGWEEIFSWWAPGGTWYYFRKVAVNGKTEKIYTDYESKYYLYNKLLRVFAPLFIAVLLIEINALRVSIWDFRQASNNFIESMFNLLMIAFFAGVIVMVGYWIVSLLIARNRLKNKLNQKF